MEFAIKSVLIQFLRFFVSFTPLSTSVVKYVVVVRMSTSQVINFIILLGIVCLWIVVYRLVMGEIAAITSRENNSSGTM